MLVRSFRWVMVVMLALGLFFAGGESRQAEAKGKHKHYKKVGFFKRTYRKIKRKIKRVCKKIKRGIVLTGARIQNRIMDTGVKIKSRITGKRPKRVWVCGHYKKGNKTLTNGHWRRNTRKKGGTGGATPGQGGGQAACHLGGEGRPGEHRSGHSRCGLGDDPGRRGQRSPLNPLAAEQDRRRAQRQLLQERAQRGERHGDEPEIAFGKPQGLTGEFDCLGQADAGQIAAILALARKLRHALRIAAPKQHACARSRDCKGKRCAPATRSEHRNRLHPVLLRARSPCDQGSSTSISSRNTR
jgi:hypothetical protein